MKLVVEPTGALGLAALMWGRVPIAGLRVGVILSGGNADVVEAGRIFERFGAAQALRDFLGRGVRA
jgi:threonine dehydratase